MQHMKLFAGNSNVALAEAVAAHLGIEIGTRGATLRSCRE